ncbi:Ionotropic receptor 124 [Hyalella azteca]|uniref:Ionotropic receptor 124 n=1 Tax=Hyalella azteca TaxID=294128 RepID=A0A6A0HD19_HYAAZ|nr:Ionotropic receptor 124 [Hyalella azteca]
MRRWLTRLLILTVLIGVNTAGVEEIGIIVLREVGQRVVSVLTHAGLNAPSCSHVMVAQPGPELQIVHAIKSDPALQGSGTLSLLPHDALCSNSSAAAMDAIANDVKATLSEVPCSSLLLLTDSMDAAVEFTDAVVRQAALKWHTRFLWVTSLQLDEFQHQLRSSWLLSMMNAAVMSWTAHAAGVRTLVYHQLPFSSLGPRIVTVEDVAASGQQLFPHKFNDFHGAVINVTALSFYPFWLEEPQGAAPPSFRGTDYHMLTTIGQALNFTHRVLPCRDWAEVLDKVAARESFMASVMHYVYLHRLKTIHFTRVFDISDLAFCMRNPVLTPKWEGLVYPLSGHVWGALLLVILIIPVPFTFLAYGARQLDSQDEAEETVASGVVTQALWFLLHAWQVLLGQHLPRHLPITHSFRTLVMSWMIFSFLVTAIYKSNLVAHLTLPKAPFRPETLSELVSVGASITGPPYAEALRQFFLTSDNSDYGKLGSRFKFVDSMQEGMALARTSGTSAHVEDRTYLIFEVAKSYTQPDGSSDLYIAKEGLIPGYLAYPVPHNAPYVPQFDKWMGIILQAGLPWKWRENELQFTLSQQRKQAAASLEQHRLPTTSPPSKTSSGVVALTLVHLQGPFLLAVLGWILGGLILLLELLVQRSGVCGMF